MKDQKISTELGATILIIIAATVAGFVLICFKNYPVKDDVISAVIPKEIHRKTFNKDNELDLGTSKIRINTEILTPKMVIDKIDSIPFESAEFSIEFYEQVRNDFINKDIGPYPCVTSGPFIEAIKCYKSEKLLIDDREYLYQVNLAYDYTGSPVVILTWAHFDKDILLLGSVGVNMFTDDLFNYDYLEKIEDIEKRKSVSYSELGLEESELAVIRNHMENHLRVESLELEKMQGEFDSNVVAKYVRDRSDAEKINDPQQLRDLSKSEYFLIRRNVASNENTPEDVLVHLSTDKSNLSLYEYDYIKVAVKLNPNTPKKIADSIDNPF